ncbi:MAG: ankyrin repeat domain-containing protein [Treponema sp.]
MNWLVIAPDVKDENLIKVEEFLEERNNTPYEIFIYDGIPKDELYDDIKHIMQTTHCIVLDSAKMTNLSDYVFIMGALSGKGLRTFIYTGGNYLKRYETLNSSSKALLNSFSSVEDMLSFIDKNFKEYEQIDKQKSALIQLFTLGIPFTGDSFALFISKDDTEKCQLFLDAGMLVNAKTSDGTPLLCVAARNKCLNKVKWLVENGANIDSISLDRGYSAVMDAVWRKDYSTTKYLVEKGANLNFISLDGQPLIVLAVGNGNLNIVELLLNNGANPDVKDSLGMSARDYASLFKKQDIIKLMETVPKKA